MRASGFGPRASAKLVLLLVAAPFAARADTFENKATGAQRVHRLENIVWALTATCDKGDDTERRQCRIVRDARVAELQTASLLVDADADAFDVGMWNGSSKSMPLQLTGCIRCAGVEVDGKTWFITASGTSPRFEAGKLKTGFLHDNARSGFANEAAAMRWTRTLDNARVQLVVKLPPKPRWTLDGKNGLNLDVIAYRVVVPCDGSIVLASPASGAGEVDPKLCVAAPAEPAAVEAPKLDMLTTNDIQDAMKPVAEAARACFEHFGVAGKAKLRMTVLGDGTIAKYEQQGDLAGTPTGECIDRAIKRAKFPRTKKAKSGFVYPIDLH